MGAAFFGSDEEQQMMREPMDPEAVKAWDERAALYNIRTLLLRKLKIGPLLLANEAFRETFRREVQHRAACRTQQEIYGCLFAHPSGWMDVLQKPDSNKDPEGTEEKRAVLLSEVQSRGRPEHCHLYEVEDPEHDDEFDDSTTCCEFGEDFAEFLRGTCKAIEEGCTFINTVAANTGKAIGAWWQQTVDKPKRSSAACQGGIPSSAPLQQLPKVDQVCAERPIMAQQQQQQRQHQRQRSLSLCDLRVDTALHQAFALLREELDMREIVQM
ncbi:hypothetical protein JKP88DRAFT_272468 [Tribonema minus]|uniref:Uncharacterized protein n=1 Tax=Tribonema minus TaxID=303371 RepID=A0A835ZJ88_9STRA|nr:hypothetical protein JKP88DRAFT_272468 [Tribonema minus]